MWTGARSPKYMAPIYQCLKDGTGVQKKIESSSKYGVGSLLVYYLKLLVSWVRKKRIIENAGLVFPPHLHKNNKITTVTDTTNNIRSKTCPLPSDARLVTQNNLKCKNGKKYFRLIDDSKIILIFEHLASYISKTTTSLLNVDVQRVFRTPRSSRTSRSNHWRTSLSHFQFESSIYSF